MKKIKKIILGTGVFSAGLFLMSGHTSALEYGESYSRALTAGPQWEVRTLGAPRDGELGDSSKEALVPRSVIDPEPFHREKEDGKVFLRFRKRDFLGDREVHKSIVTEQYEEKMRPEEWVQDAERKLSRLIVKSFFIKNSEEIPFGEEEKQVFSWVRATPTAEKPLKTRDLEGESYELFSTQDIWEVYPGVQVHVDRPREEWKKVYVAPTPAPQPAPPARHVQTGYDSDSDCVLS